MKYLVCTSMLLVAGWASALNYPVGTFLISGLAKNERNLAFGAQDDSLRIQACSTNGTILAETAFYDATDPTSPENFLLEVPMTLKATSSSAAVGDSVRLCLVRDGDKKDEDKSLAVSSAPIVLSSSEGTTNLILQLYATVSYTNASQQVVTLPKDYVDGLSTRYVETDSVYDLFADDDGDGQSNYAEYLAGTDPFEKTDRLMVTDFRREGGRVALTFEYVGGVVYGVSASPSLDAAKAAWKGEKLAIEPDETPGAASILPSPDVTATDRVTLYLLPAVKADAMFYRLEVK